MLSFATFAGIAEILHASQKMADAPYHARAITAALRLTSAGIIVMVSDLTLAGLAQGELWKAGAPWVVSLRASEPYWLIGTLSAIPITAGIGLLCYGLLKGPRGAGARALAEARATTSQAGSSGTDENHQNPVQALRMSYIAASVAGVTFFITDPHNSHPCPNACRD